MRTEKEIKDKLIELEKKSENTGNTVKGYMFDAQVTILEWVLEIQ